MDSTGPMASLLAPLLPTLAPATLILIGFLVPWQRMNHLQDSMNELRSDMKDGFKRMERQFDKQQDLILALTDPARRSPMPQYPALPWPLLPPIRSFDRKIKLQLWKHLMPHCFHRDPGGLGLLEAG